MNTYINETTIRMIMLTTYILCALTCIVTSYLLIHVLTKINSYEKNISTRLNRIELLEKQIHNKDVYKPPKHSEILPKKNPLTTEINEYIERDATTANNKIIGDILKEFL